MALTDEAIRRIKDMIVAGDLRPGERLPPERELGERLGLSRNSLREAVKALELIRVLDVRRGDGTYVTSLEPRLLLESLSFVLDLHQDRSVLELFAVRRILEPAAAQLAAQRLTPVELDELAAILDDTPPAAPAPDLVSQDLAFHRRIAEASGNGTLAGLIESLANRTVRARLWRGITESGAGERTSSEHRAILAALAARDGALAAALTIGHIAGVERWLHSADAPDHFADAHGGQPKPSPTPKEHTP